MTDADNETLLREYVQAVWGGHDAQAALEFFAPEYRRHLSPTAEPLDAQGQIARLTGFMKAFPDVTLTVETVVADGDRVAFAGLMRGTHQGAFLGHEPTGKPFEIYLFDMVRIADGRIAEHWGGPDLHDLLKQTSA